tara:strand:+ start:1359 stop:2045 length:687 start_codon:yes stop_codon:yes gene_type:complete
MFSRVYNLFGSSAAHTRFESCDEFKEIWKILEQLQAKENELYLAKQSKGAASVDFGKHTILSKLLSNLYEEIDDFNGHAVSQSKKDEYRDMIVLIHTLRGLINHCLDEHGEMLNTFRDTTRQNLTMALEWGETAATIASLYAAPISILYKLGIYFGASSVKDSVNDAIKDSTGLSEKNTRTMLILKMLDKKLNILDTNLLLLINDGDQLANSNNDNNEIDGSYARFLK